jgi:hypothetical protein
MLKSEAMNRAHRPFWVLRHRVTGETKVVPYPDSEDSFWEVCLTDGSDASAVAYQQPRAPKPTGRSRPKAHPRLTGGASA